MVTKHVPGYSRMSFLRLLWRVDLRGLYAKVRQSSRNRGTRVEQPSVTSFFQNYNILPRSGVRAETLRAGSENMPNFITFWSTLSFKDD